ncbi:MAG: (Fe-S)-binding protein, partial [Candidatus Helarchaeota archaeon]
CPTAIVSGSESFTPYIRSLHINLKEKKIRSYDDGALMSIFSCLTCNQCNTFCLPKVNIEELIKLARSLIVESGIDISKYSRISESISQHHNPLAEPHHLRTDSFKDLLPVKKAIDTVLFLGCMSSYREVEIARTSVELLQNLGVDFTIMTDEWCCGSPAHSTGFMDVFKETLEHNVTEWKVHGIKTIITPCSACYRTIKTLYPRYVQEFDFTVLHMIEVLLSKLNTIQLKALNSKITFHDPCHLGRALAIFEEPRSLLHQIPGIEFIEMAHSKDAGLCCGAGGGVRNNFPDLSKDIGSLRVKEAIDIGADYIISACPLCKFQLKNYAPPNLQVLDVIELINQLIN